MKPTEIQIECDCAAMLTVDLVVAIVSQHIGRNLDTISIKGKAGYGDK